MLTYSEGMSRLSEMKSRFDDGFSSSDRLFLQETSIAVLGRPVRNTACRDCYRDAYLEIIHKLKKQGKMPKEKTFILRAGVLLHFAGESYVNDNITDTIAMDALIDKHMSIEDSAKAGGFPSKRTFVAKCKRTYNITPFQLIKQNRQKS